MNGENLEELPEVTDKTGAKFLSKIAMVFAGLWFAVMTILKGLHIIDLEITEIITSGVAVVVVWTPTYLSVYLDKLKDIKLK